MNEYEGSRTTRTRTKIFLKVGLSFTLSFSTRSNKFTLKATTNITKKVKGDVGRAIIKSRNAKKNQIRGRKRRWEIKRME